MCTRHFRSCIPTDYDQFRPFPTYPTGRGRVENKRKLIFYNFKNSDRFRPNSEQTDFCPGFFIIVGLFGRMGQKWLKLAIFEQFGQK